LPSRKPRGLIISMKPSTASHTATPAGNAAPRLARSVFAYIAAVVAASAIFVVWFCVRNAFTDAAYHINVSAKFQLGLALVFLVVNGFLPALILMALPWAMLVAWLNFLKCTFWPHFSLLAAVLLALLACATTSLAPEPLFIETQTFTQAYVTAIARQGPCFFVAGAGFGLVYWMAVRRREKPPRGGATRQECPTSI